jgi:hypothetical protein
MIRASLALIIMDVGATHRTVARLPTALVLRDFSFIVVDATISSLGWGIQWDVIRLASL